MRIKYCLREKVWTDRNTPLAPLKTVMMKFYSYKFSERNSEKRLAGIKHVIFLLKYEKQKARFYR